MCIRVVFLIQNRWVWMLLGWICAKLGNFHTFCPHTCSGFFVVDVTNPMGGREEKVPTRIGEYNGVLDAFHLGM